MSQHPPYPGDDLGLPQAGPGSSASLLRRVVAITVDWLLCQAIAMGVLGMEWPASGSDSFLPLAVLFVEYAVLVTTLGTTIGHRLLGIRVAPLTGSGVLDAPPPLPKVLIRTALLCLALPALILDSDGRGLHDKAASTIVVRTS